MSLARAHVHVLPAKIGGWQVEKDGHRIGPLFASKRVARAAGRTAAEACQPSELFIHNRDGRIGKGPSSRETYPRDSDPPSPG